MHGEYSAADELQLGAEDAPELTEWLLVNGSDWRKSPQEMHPSCVVAGVMTLREKDSEFAAVLAMRMCIRMNGLSDETLSFMLRYMIAPKDEAERERILKCPEGLLQRGAVLPGRFR